MVPGLPAPVCGLPSVTPACAAGYYLVLSNAYGMVTSQVAYLNVVPAADACLTFNGLSHCPLGQASLSADPTGQGGLLVANLGSSGQDGVAITLKNSGGWRANWSDPGADTVPPEGAFLSFSVKATLGGQSGQNVGGLRVKIANGKPVLSTDLAVFGFNPVEVQAYANGVLVGVFQSSPGDLGAIELKARWKPSSCHIGWDDGPVFELDWHLGSARVTLNNGLAVDCDLLVVKQQGAGGPARSRRWICKPASGRRCSSPTRVWRRGLVAS